MHPLAPHLPPKRATVFYGTAGVDALRSRSVSDTVLVGLLDVPAPPPSLVADWTRDIAEQLFISHRTVQNHVQSTLRKLHLSNRVELTRYAIREGIGDVENEG